MENLTLQHRDPPIIIPWQQGYSLLELMIVVAIVGILAITANFTYSPADSRLKGAARDLYSNMQTARIEATKRNEDWGIVCDDATNTYALCAYSAGACVGGNTTITLSDYDSGIQFGYGNASSCIGACPGDGISYTGPDNIAYFTSKGLSPSKGYIYLENNKDTTFAVGTSSLAGVVKIKKWSGSAWE